MDSGSTRLYNTLMGNPSANNSIGRTSSKYSSGTDDDGILGFFKRRGRSLENAFGTTGASIASFFKDAAENASIEDRNKRRKESLNNVAKQYGYDSWDAVWDARDAAEAAGDTAKLNEMDNGVVKALQQQTKANSEEATKAAKDYKDYRENNYISNKINQDRGKFAGSAINTLSTMTDVLLPTAGVALNTVQGGVEGVADELEQSGLEGFSGERAAQNAVAGALGGAAVGGMNKAIGGRNLVPGSGKISNVANKALNTGVARGGLSGAVGGAVGAGVSAAMNGQDILGSALEGAKQGALQGGVAGGVMSGVNRVGGAALNKFAPEAAERVQKTTQAWDNWKNSGNDFNERLTNTLTSGDSAVGEWLQGNRRSNLLSTAGELGNRIKDVGKAPNKYVGVDMLGNRTEYNPAELARLINEYDNYEPPRTLSGNSSSEVDEAVGRAGGELMNIYKTMNGGVGVNPYNRESWGEFNKWLQNTKAELGGNQSRPVDMAKADQWQPERISGSYIKNKLKSYGIDTDGLSITRQRGGTSDAWYVSGDSTKTNLKAVEDILRNKLESYDVDERTGEILAGGNTYVFVNDDAPSTPTTAKDWLKQAGTRAVEDINNTNLGMRVQDTNPQGGLNRFSSEAFEAGDDSRNNLIKAINNYNSNEPVESNRIMKLSKDGETVTMAGTKNKVPVADILEKVGYTDAVSQFPQDIQNMKINDNMANAPETEVYRTLTDENGGSGGLARPNLVAGESNLPSNQEPSMAYGESGLATGKTKKRNILSKAGRAMQAAQVGATRKETRDIGIENSGELVNKVRQRTGLSDMEKQAAFAKELTGGEKSLLDAIQANALAATEDGSVRAVDIDAIMPEVNRLIDAAPNTLVSPKKKAQIKESVIADLTNGSIDTIHKANNFKSAAAQQFLINERTPNDSAKELGKLYTKIGDLVDEASYKAIPQSQVDTMFAAGASEAHARAEVARKNGRQEYALAYDKLADELENSPKTVQAFRSLKKDYVDISKLNKKTQQGATAWNNSPLAMGSAITAAMATGNPLAAVPAAWAAKTFSPAIGQTAIDVSAKLGGRLADIGDSISTRTSSAGKSDIPRVIAEATTPTAPTTAMTQLYNQIGRTEGLSNAEQARTANYLVDAAQEAEIVPNTADTTMYDTFYGGSSAEPTTGTAQSLTGETTTTNTANSYFPATGDYWTDLLGAAMTSAIDANDVSAFTELYGMYQDAVAQAQKNASSSESQEKLTDTQRRAYAAGNSLDELEQLQPDLAYRLSDVPVIGNIATLGGNTYDAAANSLATQIGYMLSGANIKEEEAMRIGQSYVPQPWDNDAVRQQKLQRARQIIDQYKNTYTS